MKLTLIKPNIGRKGHSLYVDEGRMEPLQIGILAALTPKEVEIEFFDDRIETIKYNNPTDAVAITVETFTARRAYEISKEYRKRGVKVILGGIHVTLLPEEAAEYADVIVIGDAEPVWKTVLRDLEKGEYKKRYEGEPVSKPQQGIITRRDIFEGKGYLPITLVQFSRGCTNSCNFCASSAYFKKCHYTRDVGEVIEEIKSQKRKLLFFVDDNIVCNKEAAKELFRALIPLKVKWVSQGSIDMLEDKELMGLIVKSGGLGFVIGFESINEQNLAEMNKEPNHTKGITFDKYKKQIQELREWGLQTWAAFTLGHDNDTPDSMKETCEFAIANKFAFAAFNIIMPYPGTLLYEQLKKEGRLLYDEKWWIHEEYRFNYASIMPNKMTPEELTKVSFECRQRFNKISSIVYRATDFRTNMRSLYRFFVYLIYNPLFRKEVHKKQGMKFGYESGQQKEQP